MSQTTDHTREQSGRSGRGSRSGRNGAAAGVRPVAPAPPRRRRPALTALAVLLIVGGAALAGLLAVRMDSREPVLVVNRTVTPGERITDKMLSSTNVSGDDLPTISTDDAKQILDKKYYARQTLYAGQLLQFKLMRTDPPLEDDQAQVGVPLTSGKFPADLRDGDAVRLVRIGDAQTPSKVLCTGYVLRVAKGKSGGFGSEAQANVATVVVPQSVADQVVGATGTDDLGMALIGRGVSAGDADITDLSGQGS